MGRWYLLDWNKAKTYLIVLLVLLNLMIVLSIAGHNNITSIDNVYFSKKSIDEFYNLINQREVKINTTLPRDIYTLGTINVEYSNIGPDNYPALFEKYQDSLILDNFKKLSLFDNQVIIYDQDQVQSFTNSFISNYLTYLELNFRNMYIEENGDIIIYFNPIYNGFVFEESYVMFKFTKDGMYFELVQMKPLDVSPTKTQAITSVEAVLKALPQLEPGTNIYAIDFIYYFDTITDEEIYKVKNARAFPCWRLMISDRDFIYIPALEY